MPLIAHRGGAGWRVENTLAAFDHAVSCGAAGAELDVRLSRDGAVVVHHDDTLNPGYCRDASGDWINAASAPAISALDLARLQTFDIGTPRPDSDYAKRFPDIVAMPGQRIPLLRDVIRQVRERSGRFFLVVEIKTSMRQAAARPWVNLVDATLAVIEAEQFIDRVVLCSFDWGSLRYAMARRPGLRTWFTSAPASWTEAGIPPALDIPPAPQRLQALRRLHAGGDAPWFDGFDPRHFDGSHPHAVAAAGGDAWFAYHRDFTSAAGRELHALGLESAVWSVNLRHAPTLRDPAACRPDYAAVDYP